MPNSDGLGANGGHQDTRTRHCPGCPRGKEVGQVGAETPALLRDEGTRSRQACRQLPKAAPVGDQLELSQRPGKTSIPGEGARRRHVEVSSLTRQDLPHQVPPLPPPSSSSRVCSRSWDKDLKIVVGPVYASSAKRLINAARTENQFFKAEINNNN